MKDANKEENWIEDLGKNQEVKEKFLKGLQRLGFPLEFKIRKKLTNLGFKNVQEGYFSVFENGAETVKTFDILAYKSKSIKIINDITVRMDLQLIGDCKSTIDSRRFLFAIPESGNLNNKSFIGPIISNLQSANYGAYRNTELASQFLTKYGQIFIASDIKDTSKEFITSDNESREDKLPQHEKIYSICENTIIPALNEKFKRWRNSAINDYKRVFSHSYSRLDTSNPQFLQKEFFGFQLLVPVIITTKPILIPEIVEGELRDVKEIDYFVYEHSVMNPDKYFELMFNVYDVLIFVCNERGFDKLLEYINGMADKVFEEISTNLNRHPNRFYEDFEEMQKQEKEIQDRHKL